MSSDPPRILGVDDFAFHRGRTCGTILVDLERHRVIDLLPDREAGTLAAWLKERPGVEVVSRDRASAYAQAVRETPPDAVRTADRRHLLANLREAAGRVFERGRSRLGDSFGKAVNAPTVTDSLPRPDKAVGFGRQARVERFEQVRRRLPVEALRSILKPNSVPRTRQDDVRPGFGGMSL